MRRSDKECRVRSVGFGLALWVGLALASQTGCKERREQAPPPIETTSAPAPEVSSAATTATAAATAEAPRPYAPSRGDCDTVQVFAAGAPYGTACIDDLAKLGLTLVDLSDEWTPRVFQKDPASGDASPYRTKYIRLANQKNADLGLYGILPSLTVLVDRLSDEKRHACQAAVDRAPLGTLKSAIAGADARTTLSITKKPESKPAILAAQALLACDRFLSKGQVNGQMGQSSQIALDLFRRRHMIVARAGLDPDSLAALSLSGEELDFRALLRSLRERVAEAANVIEDGSPTGQTALVVDRELDLSRFGSPSPRDAADAAADYVGEATDAAARALGWTSAESARAFVAALGPKGLSSLRVAVKLPSPPSFHSASMDLRVEIDRGDVFYDTPVRAALARKKQGSLRGPSFVVYAKDGDRERTLVRWSTTIGGWQKERVEEGEVVLRYKESDVGERFWRHLVAAPAWMPPDSTPESELLREGEDGTHTLKNDLIQPGYLNAYGLVMLIHEEAEVNEEGQTTWKDHGIRTHGSVNYKSILRGESHGCHRLYNHLALRLSGYVLAHRPFVRRGKMHAGYNRVLEWKGQSIEVDVPTRGYLFELDPPIPVRVLEGRIAGDVQTPISSLIRLKTDPTSG